MKHFKTKIAPVNPLKFKMCAKKHAYPNLKAAKNARKRKKHRIKLRVYQCPYCHLWHLTKQLIT